VDGKRFRRRQPLGVLSREIGDQADHRFLNKVTMSDTQTPNFDQTGQFPRRADPQLSGHCVEMDTVITDQNGLRKLSSAAGEDQIEGEARLAGA
jgi:hypothetical protein